MKALPAHSFKIIPLALAVTLAGCGGGSGSSDDQATSTLTLPTITSGYMAYQVNDGGWQQVTASVQLDLENSDTINLATSCTDGSIYPFINVELFKAQDLIKIMGELSTSSYYLTGDICHSDEEWSALNIVFPSVTEIMDAAVAQGSSMISTYNETLILERRDTTPMDVVTTYLSGDDYVLYCESDISFNDGDQKVISTDSDTLHTASSTSISNSQSSLIDSAGAAIAGERGLRMDVTALYSYDIQDSIPDFSGHPGCDVLNRVSTDRYIDSTYFQTHYYMDGTSGLANLDSSEQAQSYTGVTLTGFIALHDSLPVATVNASAPETTLIDISHWLSFTDGGGLYYSVYSYLDAPADNVSLETVDPNQLPGISLPSELTISSSALYLDLDYVSADFAFSGELADGTTVLRSQTNYYYNSSIRQRAATAKATKPSRATRTTGMASELNRFN